jgi:hypothetical protein
VFGADVYGGEERTVDYTGNLVMYDEATGSYWSQVLARAVCGPRRGSTLGIVPSSLSTWGDWRAANPEGKVLLPPPFSKTAGPNSTETAGPNKTG